MNRTSQPAPVAVVLPVRGEHTLLRDALQALAGQDVSPGTVDIVVVDDDPACTAEAPWPVRVVRSGGTGPYAARNIGWRSTCAEIVLFCDVRSRPRPDWIRRTVSTFDDPTVAMVGSEVCVVSGRAWGARASAHQQIFQLANYIRRPGYNPSLPNCNLAVRRSDLAAVGGYSEARSGGDADLSWRVLARPGRRLVTIDEVLMDWEPRQEFREYLRQNYRYGTSHVHLRRKWGGHGAPVPTDSWSRYKLFKRSVRVSLRVLRGVLAGRGLDAALAQAGHVAFQAGVRKETST